MKDDLPLPPRRLNHEGRERRVGVEIELGGIALDDATRIVASLFGDEVRHISRYEHVVGGDAAGDWRVERDFGLLKQHARERAASGRERGAIEQFAETVVDAGVEQLVPLEIVSPPLPLTRLDEVERLVTRLREAGGEGTRDSMFYAFGLQLNPELPALDAATLLAYLRAFLCLYDWLKRVEGPDITRRVTGFAEPFPPGYVRRVIEADYAPALDAFIDDYLADNPTRNRALDLLPLIHHLDEARLRRAVSDERVKPRPTLHYRLPNCELERASWGFHVPWAHWLQVEHLAGDDERLRDCCSAYEVHLSSTVDRLLSDFSEGAQAWLLDDADL